MGVYDLDPGPITPEEFPLGAPIVTAGIFLALAVPLQSGLDGASAAAETAITTIGGLGEGLDDPTFDAALAAAHGGLDALELPDDAATYGTMTDTLDVIEQHNTRQRAETPDPDQPEPDIGIDGEIQPEPEPSPDDQPYWPGTWPDQNQQGT